MGPANEMQGIELGPPRCIEHVSEQWLNKFGSVEKCIMVASYGRNCQIILLKIEEGIK